VEHQNQLAILTKASSNTEAFQEKHKCALKASAYDMVYDFVSEMPSIAVISDLEETQIEEQELDDAQKALSRGIARALQRRLQEVFRGIEKQEQQKLSTYRTVQHILNTHGRMLAAYAHNCGVHDASSAARKIVQEASLSVLSVQFFDSQPLLALKNELFEVYASVLCSGMKEVAQVELSSQRAGDFLHSQQVYTLSFDRSTSDVESRRVRPWSSYRIRSNAPLMGIKRGLCCRSHERDLGGAFVIAWCDSIDNLYSTGTYTENISSAGRFVVADVVVGCELMGLGGIRCADKLLFYAHVRELRVSGIDYARLLELPHPAWGQHPSKSVWLAASNLSIAYLGTFVVFCKASILFTTLA
jgi:hypothetical protein